MTAAMITHRLKLTFGSLPPELIQMTFTELLRASLPQADPGSTQLKAVLSNLVQTSYAFSSHLWQPLTNLKREIEAVIRELKASEFFITKLAENQAQIWQKPIDWKMYTWPFCNHPRCERCAEFLPLTTSFNGFEDMLESLGLARSRVNRVLVTLSVRYENRVRAAEKAKRAELAAKVAAKRKADDELAAIEWAEFEVAQGKLKKQKMMEAERPSTLAQAAADSDDCVRLPGTGLRLNQQEHGDEELAEIEHPEDGKDWVDLMDEDGNGEGEETSGGEGAEVAADEANSPGEEMGVDGEDASRIAAGGATFADFVRALRAP